MNYRTLLGRVLFVCAFGAGAAGVAQADVIPMKATLAGAGSVKGTGMADVKLDTATNELTWKVTYSGLTGDATAAHFHGPAEVGQNASVVVPFKGPLASPINGKATITPGQAADLVAGKWYVNIHTAANPGGEIRGQVQR